MKTIKAILVDDEENARLILNNFLSEYCPNVEIIAEAEDVKAAVKLINKNEVDLVFLDIEMPNENGFALFDYFNKPSFETIFCTAYSEYAIKAFEVSAIDYLLKPYSDERLQACIDRVQQRLQQLPLDIRQVLHTLQQQAAPDYLKRLKVQIGNRIWLVAVEDILFLQASGRYIKVVTKEREALLRTPLKSLLTQLDPDQFWQIHRSIVINLQHLDHVNASEPEQLQVFIKGCSSALPVSRSAQHLFRQWTQE